MPLFGGPEYGNPEDGGHELYPGVWEEPPTVEYKFQYIELGPSLGGFFPNQNSILIREDYWELLHHITRYQQSVQGNKGAMILTGHPGIGKSLFLYFTLVYRVLHGLPTAFEFKVGKIYYFGEKLKLYDTYDMIDPEGYPGAWALSDSNQVLHQPSGEFTTPLSRFFTLQATSPQPIRWKTWSKYRGAEIYAMKLWSWEAIYTGARKFQDPGEFKDDVLWQVFANYSKSAHKCYEMARHIQ